MSFHPGAARVSETRSWRGELTLSLEWHFARPHGTGHSPVVSLHTHSVSAIHVRMAVGLGSSLHLSSATVAPLASTHATILVSVTFRPHVGHAAPQSLACHANSLGGGGTNTAVGASVAFGPRYAPPSSSERARVATRTAWAGDAHSSSASSAAAAASCRLSSDSWREAEPPAAAARR